MDKSRGRMDRITYHELLAQDSLGETRIVLNVRGRRQLTTGRNAVGHETLIEDGWKLLAAMRLGRPGIGFGDGRLRFSSALAR